MVKISQEKTANSARLSRVLWVTKRALTIRSRTQQTLMEIKDLDEITKKEDVCDSLQRVLGENCEVKMDAITSIRRAYGGTQTAVVTLSRRERKRLPKQGSCVLAGWSVVFESS